MLSCNLIIFFIQQFNQSNYSNWTAVHTSASSDRFRSCLGLLDFSEKTENREKRTFEAVKTMMSKLPSTDGNKEM